MFFVLLQTLTKIKRKEVENLMGKRFFDKRWEIRGIKRDSIRYYKCEVINEEL